MCPAWCRLWLLSLHVIVLCWCPIGMRLVIGRIETKEEMKTTAAGTGVVTRKEDNTSTTGEDKTEEWELINTAEVQVMEVRSCFLSEAWWLLVVPPVLTCIHYFVLHIVSVFCIILTVKDVRKHPQPVGPCNVGALFSVT